MPRSIPMKNFEPPFTRLKTDLRTAAPFGSSPDGYWIVSVEELPTLPIPQRVVVTREHIDIDGWIFPLSYISKSWLLWFQRTVHRWYGMDASNPNKLWLFGMVEAFQDSLRGTL